MELNYSSEKNTLILISLLKKHGIRNVVVSPGATNMRLVASLQHDSYFKLYSVVDERSAAYMACGLAAEMKEPIMLSCTGATSSRNYMPGLTEAYYRKLPILCVTSSQYIELIGQLKDQVTNRINLPTDIVNYSVQINEIHNSREEWYAMLKINEAILALKRRGGGPAHINLITNYSKDYSVAELPDVNKIERYTYEEKLPPLPVGEIGIVIGSHGDFTKEEEESIDQFCKNYGAVVFCDHTSGYYGANRVYYQLINVQQKKINREIALLIHIGEVSGDHFTIGPKAKQVWRVNPDGELRDTYKTLTNVFEMKESYFFDYYNKLSSTTKDSVLSSYINEYNEIYDKIPDLPFSNIWIAKNTIGRIPSGSVLHLGILTSLRSWNFFRINDGIRSYSNVGGFGIDGNMSSMIGASFANKDKLYFAVVGDLSFFYDINSLGNRHIGNNVRILLINNGLGAEFTHHMNNGSQLGEMVFPYICAEGHFGNKSISLVKNYVTALGFDYLSAANKEEYMKYLPVFLSEDNENPVVFEVFTNDCDENEALFQISSINRSSKVILEKKVKSVLGESGVAKIKKIIGKQ